MARSGSLVILSTATESDELDLSPQSVRRIVNVSIGAPAALTGTITIQLKINGSWYTHQSGGADITLGVDKSLTLDKITATSLRMKSSGAEGGDRTFNYEWAAAS